MQLNSKRFVVRKSLIGKKAVITVNFKNGKSAVYNHDKVYEVMKSKLETLPCWTKYKSYTASNNVPVVAREACEKQANSSEKYPREVQSSEWWMETQLSNIQRLINNANDNSSHGV